MSISVAYALKGRSLNHHILRNMLHKVMLTLHQNGTRIICCAMDGQWDRIVFRDYNDIPLTLFELQRDVWKQFKNMLYANLLNYINTDTLVTTRDHCQITRFQPSIIGNLHTGNVLLEVHFQPSDDNQLRKVLHVSCHGQKLEHGNFKTHLQLPSAKDRPHLWKGLVEEFNLYDILKQHCTTLNIYVLQVDDCECELQQDTTALSGAEHLLLHTNFGRSLLEHFIVLLLGHK